MSDLLKDFENQLLWCLDKVQEHFHSKYEETKPIPINIALSGGCDSMALLLLCKKICDLNLHNNKIKNITALTFKHCWRQEEEAQIEQVSLWCKKLNIRHFVLDHKNTKAHSDEHTRSEEKARKLRYESIIDWCSKNKSQVLLLGHHKQDQSSTFFMRAWRGSGLVGLKSMSNVSYKNQDGYEVALVRPMLNFDKKDLMKFLSEEGQEWVEDSTNQDENFERNWINKYLAHAEERLGQNHLHLSAKRLGMFYEMFDQILDGMEQSNLSIKDQEDGKVSVDFQLDKASHILLNIGLVQRAIGHCSSNGYYDHSNHSLSLFETQVPQLLQGKNASFAGTLFKCKSNREDKVEITATPEVRKTLK